MTTDLRCRCEQLALDNIPRRVAELALIISSGDHALLAQQQPGFDMSMLAICVQAISGPVSEHDRVQLAYGFPQHFAAMHLIMQHPNGRDILRAITERSAS